MHRVPKVVIVGAGFGGLFAAKLMSQLAVELIVIDRHNYHFLLPRRYGSQGADCEKRRALGSSCCCRAVATGLQQGRNETDAQRY